MIFDTKKHLTQRNLYTQTAHRSFYRPIFLHAELYPEQFLHSRHFLAQKPLRRKNICTAVFTHRRSLHKKLSAQKSYAQKVLRTTFFTYRCFYTHMFLHRHKLHTETCAHLFLFAHSQLLHREALLPLLDDPTFRVPPLKSHA